MGLALLFGVGGGTYIAVNTIGRVKDTLTEGAKRAGEALRVNGAITQTDQQNIKTFLSANGLDSSQIYFNSSTSRQGYGSTQGNGAVGYNFTLSVPGLKLPIYKQYIEEEIPNVQSTYVTGMTSDTTPVSNTFNLFGGTQNPNPDLGSIQTINVTNPGIVTSITLTGPSSVTVGQSATYSGIALMGSTPAPAGTQVKVSSPYGSNTVTIQSNGVFQSTVKFLSVGSSQPVTSTAGLGVATQLVTVTPGAISNFVFIGVTTSPNIYQSTVGSSVTITGIATDSNGNPISGTTISVTSNAADFQNLTLRTDNKGKFSLAYTPKTLNSVQITFSSGTATANAVLNVSADAPQAITLMSSTGTNFGTAPLTITAGQVVNLQGTVSGPYSSPVPDIGVLISSPTDITDNFTPNKSITTDSNGNYSDNAITLTQAGTHYIQATAAGIETPAQVQLTVNPANPASVTNLQAIPVEISAGATVTVIGQVFDQYGNSPPAGTNLSLVGPDETTGITTDARGQFSASQVLSTPGLAQLKVQFNNKTLLGGTVTVNVLPTGAYSIQINPSATSVIAGNSLTATITVKDTTGAPAGGKILTLSETPEPSALISTSFTTDSSGKADVTIGPLTQVGYHSLAVTMNGVSNVMGTATFKVNPGSPKQVVATVSPSVTQVWTSGTPKPTVSGTLMDAYGNAVPNTPITINGGYGASASGSTDSNGYFLIAITPTNQGGPYQITITSGSWSQSPSGLSITVTTKVNYSITLTASPATVSAGTAVTATATITDAGGTPVSGLNLTFSSPSSPGATITAPAATNASGQTLVQVIFTKAGQQVIQVVYQNVQASASVTVNSAAPANVLELTLSPTVTVKNPTQGPVVTGVLVDTYNNPIPSASVTISGGWGANSSATTNSSGAFSATLNPVNTGTFTMTISSGTWNKTFGSPTLTVTATQGYTLNVTAPATTSAGVAVTAAATLKDQAGNPVSGVTLSFSSPTDTGATITASAVTNSSGQTTVQVTWKKAGNQVVQAVYQNAQSGAAVAVNPDVPSDVLGLALSPTITVKNPAQGPIVTGVLVDKYNNPISSASVSISGGWGSSSSAITNASGAFSVTLNPVNTGTFTMTITSGAWNKTFGAPTLTVTATQGYTLTVTAPASTTAGIAATATATLKDQAGNPVSGVTLSFSGPTDIGVTITAPAATNSSGQTTAQVTWKKAGNQVIQASYLNVQASTLVAVNPSTPTNLTANVSPSTTQVWTTGTPKPMVSGTLTDIYGNPIQSASVMISGGYGANATGSTSATGDYSFTITPTNIGTFPLNFAITSDYGNLNTIAGSITVTSKVNYSITLTASPGTVTAGTEVAATATVKDAGGNPVGGLNLTFSSPTDLVANITAPAATNASGQTTVQVTWKKAGNQIIQGSYQNVQASTVVTVNSSTPTTLVANVSPSTTQVWTSQNPVPLPLVIGTLTDVYGNAISGASITVSGGYGASASGTTDLNGYFLLSIKPTNVGGPFTLTFAVISGSGSLNTTTASITVVKTLTPTLTLQSMGSSVAACGQPFNISATLNDQLGNPINGTNISFTVPTDTTATLASIFPSGPAGSAIGNLTQSSGSFVQGTAAVAVTFDKTGTQGITVTATVDSQTITRSLNMYVASPQLSSVVWTSVSPNPVTAGNGLTITGQALDQFGNGMPNGTSITLKLPGSDASNQTVYTASNSMFSGTLVPSKTGTYPLYASNGSINVSYGTEITVNPGSLATGSMVAAISMIVQPGSNIITFSGFKDSYGNLLANKTMTATGSYTGSTTGYTPPSLTFTTDSNGYAQVVTPTISGVAYGKIVYNLGPLSCEFDVLSNASAIAGGNANGYALDSTGHVWAWGMGSYGKNGNGLTADQKTPVQVSNISGIVAIASGAVNGYVLDSNGNVWAWGDGEYYGLGNGTSPYTQSTPVQVSTPSGIVAIAGENTNGLALDSTGHVWAWGYGSSGQLGNGTTGINHTSTPVQVLNISGIVAIAGGYYNGYALDSTGNVWAWGDGSNGQLGNGSTTDQATPVQVSNLSGIVSIASFNNTTYALDSTGNVWAWGDGSNGQLGNGTNLSTQGTPVQVANLSGIIAIASGANNGYALDNTGHVWAWGRGSQGQLGNGSTSDKTTPVQVANLSGIVAITGGSSTGYALDSTGHVWAWGQGDNGKLGNGSTADQTTPVQVTQSGWTVPMR